MKRFFPFVSCAVLLVVAVPLQADPTALAQPALDTLVGKRQVVGFTVRGGSRFLGRVLSADHNLYVVQTFHYVSAPATSTQTMTFIGRNRRRSQGRRQITTQNMIADDTAVQALVSGVAGGSFRPREEAGPRELIAPGDILCLQALSPPAKIGGSTNWTLKTLYTSPDLPAVKPAAGKPAANSY